MKTSGVYAADPSLSKGTGFHLQPDGNWGVEQIPEEVIRESEFSGYLTIYGYKSAVFETADKQMWAQKVSEAEEEVSEAETEFEKETEMKPSQVSSTLRRIAIAIEKSKRPDKNLVAQDLKKIVVAISNPAQGLDDNAFEQWRGKLTNEDNLVESDLMVSFYIKPNSPLDSDTDGEIGVEFTQLLENAGLKDISWTRNAVIFTIPRGDNAFDQLQREILNGNHGPKMIDALNSLKNPGMVSDEVWPDNEYYLMTP